MMTMEVELALYDSVLVLSGEGWIFLNIVLLFISVYFLDYAIQETISILNSSSCCCFNFFPLTHVTVASVQMFFSDSLQTYCYWERAAGGVGRTESHKVKGKRSKYAESFACFSYVIYDFMAYCVKKRCFAPKLMVHASEQWVLLIDIIYTRAC